MGFPTATIVDEIRSRGAIRDSDVTRLKAAIAKADVITVDEAEALLSLHATAPLQDAAWGPFLIATIAEYVVQQAEPPGYVVSANARWLIDRISIFGRVETLTELALLIHVLETARWAPPSLAAFALDQIRHAVETGSGPLRAGREDAPGRIHAEEVELAGRILRAFGRETSLAVTRIEADALIAINRAIAPGQSSPAWSALFVRAVGGGVLAATGHAVPSRHDIVDAVASGVISPELLALVMGGSGQARRSLDGAISGRSSPMPTIWSSAPILSLEERAIARLERQRLEIVTSEVIEEPTDIWLMSRLAERKSDTANEVALLAYVTREASRLPQELAAFAASRAIAA